MEEAGHTDGMAGGSCQRIKDLTYQKQVQIYSNWENEIMPEKTVKRAKNTLQKKHRAFNKPTRKIFLKFTQEFHLSVMVTSKRQSFSPLSLSPHINIHLPMCMLFTHLYIQTIHVAHQRKETEFSVAKGNVCYYRGGHRPAKGRDFPLIVDRK